MRVRCCLCEFEERGLCLKKRRNGNPTKIKVNKPRNCSLYKEDPLRVLADYRKKEAHKNAMKRQQLRNIRIDKALQELREKRSREGSNF